MNNIESSTGEIIMYQPDETIRLEVRMDEETVWLSGNYDQRNRPLTTQLTLSHFYLLIFRSVLLQFPQ